MIEKSLLEAVNSGHCLVFVGSGPSIELGLPSWEQLAKNLAKHVLTLKPDVDTASYETFLSQKKYPELFGLATDDVGQSPVVEFVRAQLTASVTPDYSNSLYNLLAGWPFAFYLTTNLDESLHQALSARGIYCTKLSNSKADLSTIRADTKDVIVHLHGMLSGSPEEWVLTSRQYAALATDSGYEYYREKLQSLFEMFGVLIVGYSLRDPDINLVLQTAKEFSDVRRPIHMFLADITEGEARDLYATKNIAVYRYEAIEGPHSQLKTQ